MDTTARVCARVIVRSLGASLGAWAFVCEYETTCVCTTAGEVVVPAVSTLTFTTATQH